MIWKILAAPVIGAIIGYCTNWLAVKMLFRPSEAKYIGKFHLPFTPGVIPRGKERLAHAIGNVVNTQLLTQETLEGRLLSNEVLSVISEAVDDALKALRSDEGLTIRRIAVDKVDEGTFNATVGKLQELLIQNVYSKLKNANIGQLISETIASKLEEAMGNSFFKRMMGDSMIATVRHAIHQSVDNYIDQNGEHLIRKIVLNETEKLLSMPAKNIVDGIENSGYDINKIIIDVYVKIVREKSSSIINIINAGEIAFNAVNGMTNDQLEELVMSAMKTELNAVVNLGAAIGLVLGLINMLIYLL